MDALRIQIRHDEIYYISYSEFQPNLDTIKHILVCKQLDLVESSSLKPNRVQDFIMQNSRLSLESHCSQTFLLILFCIK